MNINENFPSKFFSEPHYSFPKAKRVQTEPPAFTVGPGSYELLQEPNIKAIPFVTNDKAKYEKLLREQILPGPGSYDYKEENKKSLVNYRNKNFQIKNKKFNKIGNEPGPGFYDIKNKIHLPLGSFSHSFTKNIIEKSPGPLEYSVGINSIAFTNKNTKNISFSFPKQIRLPQIKPQYNNELLLDPKSYNYFNNSKTISIGKSKKEFIQNGSEINNPGPGTYEKDYFLKNFKTQSLREKLEDLMDKIKKKKSKKNIFHDSKTESPTSKRLNKLLNNKNKKIINSNLSIQKTEMISPLKKYMNNIIHEKIKEKVEKKLLKDIFILSNDFSNKRKNTGFTMSERKFDFLIKNNQVPGPAKYSLKTDFGITGGGFSVSDRKTIFDMDKNSSSVGNYMIGSIFNIKNRKKEKITKELAYQLKKVEELKKRNKLLKNKNNN